MTDEFEITNWDSYKSVPAQVNTDGMSGSDHCSDHCLMTLDRAKLALMRGVNLWGPGPIILVCQTSAIRSPPPPPQSLIVFPCPCPCPSLWASSPDRFVYRIVTCKVKQTKWVKSWLDLSHKMKYFFSVIQVTVVPCLLLGRLAFSLGFHCCPLVLTKLKRSAHATKKVSETSAWSARLLKAPHLFVALCQQPCHFLAGNKVRRWKTCRHVDFE